MKSSIEIPRILNEIAQAGPQGWPMPSDASTAAALDLCRAWGFPVTTSRGRAFVEREADSLIPAWIEQETPSIAWDRTYVLGFLEVDSTNEQALACARNGAPGGTVICAERQTSGRGRKGRTWLSPAGAGVYCTLVVRPEQPRNRWPMLTHAASLAVAEAIRDVLRETAPARMLAPDLKWPNDVLLSGKKTAGILLETIVPSGGSPAAVVGAGINVRAESVPEGLRKQATCISAEIGAEVPRRRLLVRFLYHFQLCYRLFEQGDHETLLERWKDNSSMWDGVPVRVDDGSREKEAVTCGLTELGALRIRNEDGTEETLLAGDVTVRRV
jgi:BirA family biotin operon repressor/biotin-[acetyl-CoA-carboxylase] ligase